MASVPTIRSQIEPHLRAAGIKPTAEAAEIHRVSLQRWLAGEQTISDEQIERLVKALELQVIITKRRKP